MAQLDINVLGQQYKIGCPDDEQESLLKTVVQVDEHLKELRMSGRNLRNEQLIVMATLNYRHQLNVLQAENQAKTQELNLRIEKLQSAISGALDKKLPSKKAEPSNQSEEIS